MQFLCRKNMFMGFPAFIAFVSAVLFGQVFTSVLSSAFGLDNRYCMLIFRGCLAAYSSYIVLNTLRTSKKLFSNIFVFSLLSFWAYYFSRLLWDFWINGIILKLPLWEFFAWGLGSCLLPALAGFILSRQRFHQTTAFIFSWIGLLLLAIAAVGFFAGEGFESSRFALENLNPINASHAFFALSLFGFSSLLWSARNAFSRLLSLLALTFGFTTGIYAGSRGAFLSFLIAMLVLFCLFANDCQPKNKIVMPTFLALVSLIVSVIVFNAGFSFRLLRSGIDQNSSMRLFAIRESIDNFWLHPWAGAGFELHNNLESLSFQLFNGAVIWYPHNFIAEAIGLGGIILIVPLLACLWFAFNASLGVAKDKKSESWRLALLIQGLGFCMFSGHLSNVPMFWVCLGIGASSSEVFLDKSKSNA